MTRDEIRVTDIGVIPASRALEAFFNRRFEFYGRRMRLIARVVPGADTASQKAAAQASYAEDQAFASTAVGGNISYADELARLGVVVVHWLTFFPETYMSLRRPYLWQYPMANDKLFALTGDWFCARFAGRNAAHAGDPLLQTTRRRLGVVLAEAGWEGTSIEPLDARLRSCGDRVHASMRGVHRGEADSTYYQSFWQNAMLRMKTSDVTTVACFCEVAIYVRSAMLAATNQGYFPEWILTTFLASDALAWVRAVGRDQAKSLMLLSASPMERSYPDHPSNWAVQEVNNGGYPATSLDQFGLNRQYRIMLVLASGFQMAGPRLTPETFERGLHRARFPNPSHRIMAGAVGFTDGDHSMTDDAAEIWWSNTAPSPYAGDGPGAFCYVDNGARRRMGTFPRGDPFFAGPCHNGSS